MQTFRVNSPFLPNIAQVKAGAGNMLAVFSTVPDGFRHRSDGAWGGAYPVECVFYDGDPRNGGTQIHAMAGGNSGDATLAPLNITFTNGLFVNQVRGGEINVALS
jgi:hypothetical protein